MGTDFLRSVFQLNRHHSSIRGCFLVEGELSVPFSESLSVFCFTFCFSGQRPQVPINHLLPMSLRNSQTKVEDHGIAEAKNDDALSYSDPEKLWYIHGRAYNLADFVSRHPGKETHFPITERVMHETIPLMLGCFTL